MRATILSVVLVGLVGCGGGGISGSERSTIETILRTPNDKGTADSLQFSGWDSTTIEEDGKTWKVVRVKYTGKKGGTGDAFSRDVLVKYSGEPTLDMPHLENKAGDDWKKDVKSLKW